MLWLKADKNGNPSITAASNSSNPVVTITTTNTPQSVPAQSNATIVRDTSTYSYSEKNKLEYNADDWHITLNQFIGTTLAVSNINDSFGKRTSIKMKIERLQANRRKCVVVPVGSV